MVGKLETGFAVPPPRPSVQAQDVGGLVGNHYEAGGVNGGGGGGPVLHHASVLPVRASPKETSGFANDAFKPLWQKERESGWDGFVARR